MVTIGCGRSVKPVTFSVLGKDGKDKAVRGTVSYIHPTAPSIRLPICRKNIYVEVLPAVVALFPIDCFHASTSGGSVVVKLLSHTSPKIAVSRRFSLAYRPGT